MMNDECGMPNAGRRGFLKGLVGLVVAPLVPVPEVVEAVTDVEPDLDVAMSITMGEWLGKLKTKEMREHLLEGMPLPIRCHYRVEFEDEPEAADDDDE